MARENGEELLDDVLKNDTHDYGDDTSLNNQEQNNDGIEQEETNVDDNHQQDLTPQQAIDGQQKTTDTPQLPNNQQQPGQQQVADPNANPNNFKRVGAQFADGKGNIVDSSGKILARAGESARHWQRASRAEAQVENLTRRNEQVMRQMQDAQAIIQQAREISELPNKLGVSREDYNEGVTLMSKWRANPVEVAREVVARTLSFGYNVTDILGKDAGDALEMKAIAQLVKQSTAPIQQQAEQARQQQETSVAATRAYEDFVTRYEHADTHADAIANLMNQGVPAVDAYYRVREFAVQNRLDFSQPLAPQVAAMQRQNGQRSTEQRRTAPMVAGNGRGTQTNMTTEPAMADANDDWGSILRSAMQQGN